MIRCGWCGKGTAEGARCGACGHVDPALPWVQRGQEPPAIQRTEGRPSLTVEELRKRLEAHPGATDEQLAELFDRDPRSIRRWRQKVSG